ncbi:MAG: hypothetical protein ACM3S2_03095 [Ignavibacteriales bacterium]
MAQKIIHPNEWTVFLNDFNKKHRGKIISLEVTDDNKKKIDEISSIPLKEIGISSVDKENTVTQIIAGMTSTNSHFIDLTDKIVLEQSDSGNPLMLRIISSKGRSATIRFLSMAD